MARPTSLRILSERPVRPEDETDTRTVNEAFTPNVPPQVPQGSVLSEDVLTILRQSHERISGEVRQAATAASLAVEKATEVEQLVQNTTAQNLATVDARINEAGNKLLLAVKAETQSSNAKSVATALTAASLQKIGSAFTGLLTFVADRTPSLLTLAGGWLLWKDTLVDPDLLKLTGLALYGAAIVAPATWLSSKRKDT